MKAIPHKMLKTSEQAAEIVQRYRKRYARHALDTRVRNAFNPRVFKAYCVGNMKTGTHSVAGMFENYSNQHESTANLMISLTALKQQGTISPREIKGVLKGRDRYHWMEMDSSNFLAPFIDELVALHKDSKFILTVRDCITWVDSVFNYSLSLYDQEEWNDMLGRKIKFDLGIEYTAHDQLLKTKGFRPLRAYFRQWRNHNAMVMDAVPEDRLLVLETKNLGQSGRQLAEFLGIPQSTLHLDRSHSFKTQHKFNVLSALDQEYVLDVAREECGSQMEQLFPEIPLESFLQAIQPVS